MASGLFCKTFMDSMNNAIALDLDGDTFKCALTTATYSPDYEADASAYTDITNELPGTGNYDVGGKTLTGISVTKTSDTSGQIKFDADDVSWADSTLSNVAKAVIYDDDLSPKALIACIDFGGAFSTTSGTFQIQWNTSGIFTLDLVP